MRAKVVIWALGLLSASWLGAQSSAANAVDCSKLNGRSRSACEAKQKAGAGGDASAGAGGVAAKAVDASPGEMPTTGVPDPPDASGVVGASSSDASRRKGADAAGAGEMPTAGVPDPPSESMEPLRPSSGGVTPLDGAAPTGSSPSSSSSSSSRAGAEPGSPAVDPAEEDAAPTVPGGDSPVKSAALKDLGSHADTSGARAKLEQTRVEDDLKVGGFYFKSGNLAGATARYQDALQHDPDNPDAHFGLAQVLLKQNKRDEAARQLQAYVKLAPDDDHTKEAQKLLVKLGPVK